jgi:hypothetical protein
MQPLLMSLSLCLLGFSACVLILAAASRGDGDEEEAGTNPPPLTKGEQFFLDEGLSPGPEPEAPEEKFLYRLRSYVRSERAAAEAFLDVPDVESLHAANDSPLEP